MRQYFFVFIHPTSDFRAQHNSVSFQEESKLQTLNLSHNSFKVEFYILFLAYMHVLRISVSYPDPDRIWIQLGQRIRIQAGQNKQKGRNLIFPEPDGLF
jgi:hypothetical protein